eukprot:gene2151-biopygen11318
MIHILFARHKAVAANRVKVLILNRRRAAAFPLSSDSERSSVWAAPDAPLIDHLQTEEELESDGRIRPFLCFVVVVLLQSGVSNGFFDASAVTAFRSYKRVREYLVLPGRSSPVRKHQQILLLWRRRQIAILSLRLPEVSALG